MSISTQNGQLSKFIDVFELTKGYWFTVVPAAAHIFIIHHPIRTIDHFGLILKRVLFWNTEIKFVFYTMSWFMISEYVLK